MFIEFDSKEVDKFIDELDRGVRDVKDRQSKFMNALGPVVYRDVIEHFEREQGPQGKWKPWSKNYREYMQKIGRDGNQILQSTGRLRQAFKPTNYRISGEYVYWYNNAKTGTPKKGAYRQTPAGTPYAYMHDEGVGVPKREFMYLSEPAKGFLIDAIFKYILRG